MLYVILIAIAVVGISMLLLFLHAEKLTTNTVLCFTGGLGSGKTYMAVRMAIKFYNKQKTKYFFGKLLGVKKWQDKPYLISNIPIKIKGKQYSHVLTREHLLLQRDIPEKAIVLIDEVGQVASQYDYDNPNVMCEIQELIRFYRHYTDGKLILTDQSSSNIVVPIRRRINYIYCLNNFRRWLKIAPFFKVDVSCLEVTEEQLDNVSQIQTQEQGIILKKELKKPYFCGYLPYNKKKGHYDSRCYSIRYNHDLMPRTEEEWEQIKTAYIIDVEVSEQQRKNFKKDRKSVNKKEIKEDEQSNNNRQSN